MDAPSGAVDWVAPEGWSCIDFISDLHLADAMPKTFEAWRSYLQHTPADAVVILGDLFDVWIGDDARHTGLEALGAAVLTQAAARRSLHFMVGNRDFLLGAAMLEDCGISALHDPTVLCAFGERVLLTHGDAWCIDDFEYQRFRGMVRNPVWQAQVLGRPLAERRAMAGSMRSASEHMAATQGGAWIDVDQAVALRWLHATDSTTLVHGHTHHPGSELLAPGLWRHVLSDWDLDHADAPRAEVLRWTRGRWDRLAPADASAARA